MPFDQSAKLSREQISIVRHANAQQPRSGLREPSGGEVARERDEGLEGGGGIAPIGIIEAQRLERRRPVFENAHQPSRSDVVADIGFHEIADPHAVCHRDPRQGCFVKRDRPLDVELQVLAALLEPPSEQCAIGKPATRTQG